MKLPPLTAHRSFAGVSFALVSAAGFSLQGLFARLAYEAGATATSVGLIRWAITAVILWLYVLLRHGRDRFPLRVSPRTTVVLLVLGGVGYFLGSFTYLSAVVFIPVSLAGLLLYTYPALATVLAVALGSEHVTRRLGAGLAVATAGVALTLGAPALGVVHAADWRGVLLVLSSALLYALYIVGSDRMLPRVHSILALAYISSAATVSFAVLTAASRSLTLDIGLKGWLAIAGMAIASTVIAAGGFLAALRRLGPARATTLSTVEPLFTVVFAGLILGERLSPIQLLGGLVILGGVILVIRERTERAVAGS